MNKKDKKTKILIADDEEGICLSLNSILELEGYETVTVNNGYDAIEKVKQESFDIAFLDIKMPGINGVDTFKIIKEFSPETVVFMMTAYAVEDLIKESIENGAYACLYKPLNIEKILQSIKEIEGKPFVLVIDDDAAIRDIFSERLTQLGFHVISVSSGLEGIKFVERKLPDVILIDVVMEEMDGVETLKRLKELLREKCPKIMMMSSYDVKAKFEEARQLGAIECLKKPININELKTLLDKILCSEEKMNKILIIDDDKALCDILKETLIANGYNVEVGYSGKEAIEKIRKEFCKVVTILDIKLPDIDGLKVYEEIKNINPDVGVIFITGYPIEERKNGYIYLQKPFTPQEIIKMIEIVKKKNENVKKNISCR